MAQTTEAACLLQTGAQYARRIGLRGPDGLVFAGLKRGAFSLYFDDEPIVHFDLEGRWQRAFREGVHYRKALDGSIDAIERPREGTNMVLRRRSLSFAEASDLDAAIRALALDVAEGLSGGRLEPVAPPESIRPIPVEELRGLLDRVANWDASAWFAQREAYLATYGPLPFLPPECHQSVVLQATLGDGSSGGSQVRSPSEFAGHVRAVSALWGRRVLQANGVFLAGPDVLRRPAEDVAAYLDAIASVFPISAGPSPQRLRDLPEDEPRLEGIDAFLDDPAPPRPIVEGWRRLRERHLRRVNLGIESGDPEIRRLSGKTWRDDEARAIVSDLKAAGIAVRVVTLVGLGTDRHVATTAELIGSLGLGRGDLVYLIDADETGPAGVELLAEPGRSEQRKAFTESLAGVKTAAGFKIASYNPEKQWN